MKLAMNRSLPDLVEKHVRHLGRSFRGSLVDEVMAPDAVDHQPVSSADDAEGVKRDIAVHHAALPDLALRCEDDIIGEDREAVHWSATGTHDRDGLEMPPTHRHVELHGIDILRIAHRRAAERWGQFNGLDMIHQLTGPSS